jgi:hypothetical protein
MIIVATKIELANYNENGMLISKQSFDANSSINGGSYQYSYKKQLVSRKGMSFFMQLIGRLPSRQNRLPNTKIMKHLWNLKL